MRHRKRTPSGVQRATRSALALLITLPILLSSPLVDAANKYLQIPPEEEAVRSPAYRYANMSNEEVLAEIKKRKLPFRQVAPVEGVRLPGRLTGRLNGVWVHSVLPEERRKTTPFEILDGRLALALDDFCAVLVAHGFVEFVHFTMYRPPRDRPTKKGEKRHRHPGGMAIDLGALRKESGHWVATGPHWPSELGAKTCGKDSKRLAGRWGRELASVACEAKDLRIFHYMLSPHFDDPHSDHLHLEIKQGVKWFLYN